MRLTVRPRHPHLRHSWVNVGQPGEPLHLQCSECCKLKVLHDPARFERQVRAAAGKYNGQYP